MLRECNETHIAKASEENGQNCELSKCDIQLFLKTFWLELQKHFLLVSLQQHWIKWMILSVISL